mmetsp:Transcript_87464/g.155122  ORF Transcript_87464/g.155122 Transcript_87464/m.155122 type:complete len:808 (-) Transcript_87464:146-2569(-)
MAYQPLLNGTPGTPPAAEKYEDEFPWNNRSCKGGKIHHAVVQGDLEATKAALEGKPDKLAIVSSRFTYETIFKGQTQEGSGTALHLAASRGHVEIAEFLLANGADLHSMVTRDHKPHYDVLHAALFAEGRGGSFEMIKCLFDAKAEMTRNLDGKFPLHIAFQTGNVPVINYLREFLVNKGTSDADYKDDKVPLPLSLGISGGKMSEEQLSAAAEVTTLSLTTFINECPQCIPSFLKRLDQETNVTAMEIARNLTRFDIAKVLREAPEAAISLLQHATEEPACENAGWHPLPTRVSFGERSFSETIRFKFNPPKQYLTYYNTEHIWSFDSQSFKAPEWHRDLTNRSYGRPIYDAEIRVCHVPDLLCAEVFSALCDSANDESLFLYEDDAIRTSIKHVFWTGTCRVDLTTVMLTLWGLFLLIMEQVYCFYMYRSDDDEATYVSRSGKGAMIARSLMLAHGQNRTNDWLDSAVLFLKEGGDEDSAWIAISWIGARGLIDLWQEMMQLRGFNKIGRWRDYLSLDNLVDTIFSCLPMYLFFYPDCLFVLVSAVFLYWLRLMDCFTSAEYIGMALLPIRKLALGLGPALCVTAVGFGAFTHAFYLVDGDNQDMWPGILFESFTTLITAALPDMASHPSTFKLVLGLLAVMFFSVFILNIFISVMDEIYSKAKERARNSFWMLRANSCFQFLLRCRVMPCSLMSENNGAILMVVSSVVALGIIAFCFWHHVYRPWVSIIFFVCQVGIVLGAYQSPESPWVRYSESQDAERQPSYIWYCRKREDREPEPIVQDVRAVLKQMNGVLGEMKDRKTKK